MTMINTTPKNFLTSGEMSKFLAAARAGKHGVRDYLLGLMAYRHGLRVSELIRIRLDDMDLDAGRIFVRRSKGSMSTNHPMQGDEVRAVRAWLRERKRFLPALVLAESMLTPQEGQKGFGEARESTTLKDAGAERNSDSRGGQKISRRGLEEGNSSGGNKRPNSSALRTELPQQPLADRNGEGQKSATTLCLNGEATSRRGAHDGMTQADSSPFLFLNEKRRVFARYGINYLFTEIGKRAGLGHVHPHMLRHGCGYALANKGCDTRLIQDYLGHKDIHNTERYTRTNAARFERLWA